MRIRGPLPRLVVACVVLWCGVAACGSAPTPPAAPRTLTVSAAASLGPVYQQLADRFRASHPGVEVRLNLANSAQLAQQIVQGVPVDVFAAASADTMDVVSRAGRAAGPPVSFASNRLEIAVAVGNPRGVRGFADLANPALRVVTTAPQTPCGAATLEVARRTGTALRPVSEQGDVTAATTSVSTADADAAVVFVTDVLAARGRVQGVPVPEGDAVPVRYPIVALQSAPAPDLARAWIALVTGPDGGALLTAAGFGRP